MKYYLSFDCGTQSTKTALYDEDFNCVCEKSYSNEIVYPNPGWAQMDANCYLEHVINGFAFCIKQAKVSSSDIAAICGDGIIMGIVGVDDDCKPVTPYTPYLDSRATEEAEYVKKQEPIWIKESGNAVIEHLQPPIMAMWMLKHNEDFKKRGAKILNNGPFVLANLAGLKAKDAFIDEATLGGWIIGYDAVQKRWSPRQLEILGIDEKYLPRIVKPSEVVGYLSDEMAKKIGINAGLPIIAGAGDTMQSFLGCGIYEKGQAADVAGTAAMFAIMTDGIKEELSKSSGMYFSIASMPNTYFYWGYIRTGGLSLQWFRDKVRGRKNDSSFYDEANDKASKTPAGANGVLFFPYLQGGDGFLSNASSCFLNMTSKTELGELWRAILESIGYEYMNLAKSMRTAGASLSELTITEGGSRSWVWNQIKADMLDVDVKTMRKKEGATLSNAVLAAYALGHIKDVKETLNKVLEVEKHFAPNKKLNKFYTLSHECYMDILSVQMDLVFKSCHALRGLNKECL